MAEIHAAAFVRLRPWTGAEFAALMAGPGVFVVGEAGGGTPPAPPAGYLGKDDGQGFLLGRVAAGEAEVLTLAVLPEAQGRGLGGALMARFLAEVAARGAVRAFLEVAADNAVARRLYARHGFTDAGLRRGYFALTGGGVVDGVVMARDLPVF